jgi:tight adherence protein B
MDVLLIVLIVVLVGGVITFATIALLGRRRDEVRERLDRYTESGVALSVDVPIERAPPLAERVDKALARRGLAENIRTQLARANLKLTATEFLVATVICVVLFGGGIYVMRRDAVMALLAGVLGFFAPRWYVSYLQGKRLKAFNEQLGDTINLLVNSIRSGYSVLQAMETVAREMGPPIAEEFDRVVREVQLGLSMETALDNMLRRVNSEDLDLMITAIKVQREVGGNLAEVLDAISFTIRERVRIQGEIRALTAMGRASGYLISFLPIALTIFIYFVNPSFIMQLVENTCGWIMIGVAVLGIVLGFVIIQKIVNIDI